MNWSHDARWTTIGFEGQQCGYYKVTAVQYLRFSTTPRRKLANLSSVYKVDMVWKIVCLNDIFHLQYPPYKHLESLQYHSQQFFPGKD